MSRTGENQAERAVAMVVADVTAIPEPSVFLSTPPDLKPKQKCPECNKGRLYEAEPAVDYAWEGNAPLHLTIYLLQSCKDSYARTARLRSPRLRQVKGFRAQSMTARIQ
jgi:hypothetical protein